MNIWSLHVRRGKVALVGMKPWCVYFVLRDFTWRSKDKGSPALIEAKKAGQLASSLRVEKVAELTGSNRKAVHRCLDALKEAGWIRVRRVPGHPSIYWAQWSTAKRSTSRTSS